MKFDLEIGNIAQWVSAVCSIVLATIGVWALFFSPTSRAFVDYLHSELAIRNTRIATLESQDERLRLSIARRESDLTALEQKSVELEGQLAGLSSQRDALQAQVAGIEAERQRLATQVTAVESSLAKTSFSLVREKISGRVSSTLVVVWPFNLSSEAYSAQGIRPRKESLWKGYTDYIGETVRKLPENERALGQEVFDAFIKQCAHLSQIVFDLPPLRVPQRSYRGYFDMSEEERKKVDAENVRRDAEFSRRLAALTDRILSGQQDIRGCLSRVHPN